MRICWRRTLTSDGSHRFGQVHLLEPPPLLLQSFAGNFFVIFSCRLQEPASPLAKFGWRFVISFNFVMTIYYEALQGKLLPFFCVASWNQPPLAKFCCWIVCNSEKLIQPGITYGIAKFYCGSFYTVWFSKAGPAFFPTIEKPTNGSKLCCRWHNKEMFSSKNAEYCNFASITSSCQKGLAPESLLGNCETTNQFKQYPSVPDYVVVHIFR